VLYIAVPGEGAVSAALCALYFSVFSEGQLGAALGMRHFATPSYSDVAGEALMTKLHIYSINFHRYTIYY
jgi:hypothetical protein